MNATSYISFDYLYTDYLYNTSHILHYLHDGVIILNKSNNCVFLYLKIYWNRQVFDLICTLGIWMKPETLRH